MGTKKREGKFVVSYTVKYLWHELFYFAFSGWQLHLEKKFLEIVNLAPSESSLTTFLRSESTSGIWLLCGILLAARRHSQSEWTEQNLLTL